MTDEKRLVVAEELTARQMEQKPFVFKPTAKLYLLTGHLPTVREGGEGFWRRVKPVEEEDVE